MACRLTHRTSGCATRGIEINKIVLVLLALLVKATPTMKRIYTLIVLLGIVMSAVLTGCNQGSETSTPADTNAPPAAPAEPATK